jgi:predicted RNA-binding protein with PUA-like domain
MQILSRKFWLLKTEPYSYSIHDFAREGITCWEGVRNYQARNFLKTMKCGDIAFIYHSSTSIPGIVGVGYVSSEAIPDPTQFKPESPFYDKKARIEAPRWWAPQIKFIGNSSDVITRKMLSLSAQTSSMRVLQKGNRLSVLPLENSEGAFILSNWFEKSILEKIS